MKQIFDPIRKKYVKATPEELVRQAIIKYLLEKLNYPPNYIAVEKQLKNYIKQRADIVVYNKQLKPTMLIECKAPNIELSGKIFEQVLAYSTAENFKYLILTNGKKNLICKVENNNCIFLRKFPNFTEL